MGVLERFFNWVARVTEPPRRGDREAGRQAAVRDIERSGLEVAERVLKRLESLRYETHAYREGYREAVVRAKLGADYIKFNRAARRRGV